ncbi:MAG: hypothetical protein IKZ87_07685, partial [Actinomycetaceae bacterium]|nr:hypothetical protein [Actinomycetaceae bacterium]
MARHKYSEAEAVQKPAGELLRDELDWKLVYAWNDETFGEGGTLGRANEKEVLLFDEVRAALARLNPELTSNEIDTVITTLTSTLSTDSLMQTNEKKHQLFIGGIPLTREK